jgi:hypothetical protein
LRVADDLLVTVIFQGDDDHVLGSRDLCPRSGHKRGEEDEREEALGHHVRGSPAENVKQLTWEAN